MDPLVNIILSLDAHADEATQTALWPSNLKQGVITVAVEAIRPWREGQGAGGTEGAGD